jgi:hypothetical protein
MRTVHDEFILHQKKCSVLYDMQDPDSHDKYKKLKIPIKKIKKYIPQLGVVKIPRKSDEVLIYVTDNKAKLIHKDYAEAQKKLINNFWITDNLKLETNHMMSKTIFGFSKKRFILTDLEQLALPLTIKELKTIFEKNFENVKKQMSNNFRDYIIFETQDKMTRIPKDKKTEEKRESFNFFSNDINS